jgi:putative restriction endonuclease
VENSALTEQLLSLKTAGSRTDPKLHKPLLVAVLLRNYIKDGTTSAAFDDIEKEMNNLISRFVSTKSPARAQYPFWRLRTDGFWEIDNAARLTLNSAGDPRVNDLRRAEHRVRWTPSAAAELRASGGDVFLELVLDRYFPDDKQAVREALGFRASGDAS